MLKIHRKARKWSERDARALTDKTYQDGLLKRMMRQGLARLAPHEIEQRKELVKQAMELMTTENQRQLISDVVDKTSKGESKDEEEEAASSDSSNDTDEAAEPVRRSSRPSRRKPDRIQKWNPQTKQYEGGGVKIEVVTAAKSKSRSDNKPSTDLTIFDIYSGTGGVAPVAAEVSRCTGIRIQVVGMCEIDDLLRTKIKQRHPNMLTFSDIKDINEHELPNFSILGASPPCQGFSTMGMARGPHGKHSTSFPMITKIMTWKQPKIVVMEEVIGFLTWNSIGVHLPKQRQTTPDGRIVTTEQEGTAFMDFRNKCDDIGYYMYYTTIQLSKLNVPQFRDRLWCFLIRKDVADAIGGIPLPEPTTSESPRIGEFLRRSSTYYEAIMPASMITSARFQVHYKHKPHLVGTIQIKDHNEVISIHQVWGDLGLSP